AAIQLDAQDGVIAVAELAPVRGRPDAIRVGGGLLQRVVVLLRRGIALGIAVDRDDVGDRRQGRGGGNGPPAMPPSRGDGGEGGIVVHVGGRDGGEAHLVAVVEVVGVGPGEVEGDDVRLGRGASVGSIRLLDRPPQRTGGGVGVVTVIQRGRYHEPTGVV